MNDFSSPIAEEVRAMRAASVAAPATEVFEKEQAALGRAPMPTALLPVGSAFPDGELQDATGRPTTLRATLDGAPAVVIFYRGAWCPYCNIALRVYQEQLVSPLRDFGVSLVAISPQTADGSLSMQEKHALEFTVLSDPGNQIAGGLGILTHPSVAARDAQLEHGLDVATRNADGTTALPMPTVAILDADGRLVWIDVHPNYATRTEPAQILDAVRETLVGRPTV